jgi:hypothetical protein
MTEQGQHANAAIFAARGPARSRLVRAAVAAGIALVAAWMIALALGVLGGFDGLPGLPGPHSRAANEASSPARAIPAPAPPSAGRRTVTSPPASDPSPATTQGSSGTNVSAAPRPKPAASAPTVTQAPSPTAATSGSTHGRGSPPTATGKPVGSPGNGPDGSGAPGQLR